MPENVMLTISENILSRCSLILNSYLEYDCSLITFLMTEEIDLDLIKDLSRPIDFLPLFLPKALIYNV